MREGVLQEEREIILGLDATPKVRAELMAIAFTIGACYFSREVLERLFREEPQLLKGASVLQEWIEQAAEEGEAWREARRARAMLLRLLTARFGQLSDDTTRRIEQQQPDWCEETSARAASAASLEELGL